MIASRWALSPLVVLLAFSWPVLRAEERVVMGHPEKTEQWSQKLRIWCGWYTKKTGDPLQTREAASKLIREIDDPAAIPALLDRLKNEKYGFLRADLLHPLLKLGGEKVVAELVQTSIEDDNPWIRELAAKGLNGRPELSQYLDKYIAALYKPRLATAAAQAVRWNGLAVRESQTDPVDQKLTKALIAALVQKQSKVVPYWMAYDTGRVPGLEEGTIDFALRRSVDRRDDYGIAGSRSGRFAEYRDGYTRVSVPTPNDQVLQTLKEYSFSDYGYNQQKWSEEFGLKRARK
jgi:hypothetical protein